MVWLSASASGVDSRRSSGCVPHGQRALLDADMLELIDWSACMVEPVVVVELFCSISRACASLHLARPAPGQGAARKHAHREALRKILCSCELLTPSCSCRFTATVPVFWATRPPSSSRELYLHLIQRLVGALAGELLSVHPLSVLFTLQPLCVLLLGTKLITLGLTCLLRVRTAGTLIHAERFDETKLKSKTQEELHLGEKDAKRTLEELEIVSVPLKKLTKEKATVHYLCNRFVHLCRHKLIWHYWLMALCAALSNDTCRHLQSHLRPKKS